MTPDPPPSPPDGAPSLPPRQRPLLGELAKDTTEQDLWDFEDDDDLDEAHLAPDEVPRAPTGEIPEPRERRITPKSDKPPVGAAADHGSSPREQVKMNVGKNRPVKPEVTLPPGTSIAEREFDDLESWDDVPRTREIEDLPPEPTVTPDAEAEAAAVPETPAGKNPASTTSRPAVHADDDDEFTPHPRGDVKPLPLRPRLGLSAVERLGMIALLALLIVGGGFALLFSLMGLPTESARAKATDFPIKGDRLVVTSSETYWREPVVDGPDADTFRRGTRLLPVIDMTVEGSGAVRVLFRNDERMVMGDAVTRAVSGTTRLRLAATAGFEDLGMHAAYRTGGSRPWTAEVYEAGSVNAPGREFTKLFDINISTDRR